MFDRKFTRRQILQQTGLGLGGFALMDMVTSRDVVASSAHFRPKAKQVIHLFMNGGPSHVDTFDPKPELEKYAGKKLPIHYSTERKTGVAFPSPFKFKKYGQSGIDVSELFPEVAKHIDDICVVRSMQADVPNHEPSLMLMNCGDGRQPRPSFGSWLSYGLGTENRNLPSFVVLIPGGLPVRGADNWRSAFLPAAHQGVYVDTKQKDLKRIIPHLRNNNLSLPQQRQQLDLVKRLNELHQADRQHESELDARIQTFELAYRMQMEATDAFDLDQETKETKQLYGETDHGRLMLTARRLVERGVRYVQLYSGNFQPWDNHSNFKAAHEQLARKHDQPIAALLNDLKRRGMLEETLVLWSGEFGRTPTTEGKDGRDHNHHGFTAWLAGGGIRGGMTYGSTDDFGWRAEKDRVHIHDLHATMLHLLGLDHTRLTYRFAGRDFRLTDVHGNVVKEILA